MRKISSNIKMSRKILVNITITLLFSSMIIYTACDDTITGEDIDKRVIPDENVSYSDHIQPVFNVKCATSGCHDNQSRAGGYSMTTWSNVLQPGVVDPYTPETSRLVWRIEGTGAPIMPPLTSGVRPLTENQTDGIITWIREGAKNN